MINRKKIAGLVALCLVLVSVLYGCSKSQIAVYDDEKGDITSITFFGNKYEPENVIIIEKIISDFMSENPDIRVSYESLKGTDYYEALEKRMAAGKGDDVFMVNHDAVLKLQARGQLADLSGLSAIGHYTDRMLSQMVEADGSIYWVPTTVSVFGLYCNLDLLKAHKQAVPANLTEWEQVCDHFVAQGITPIIANNDISLKTLAIGLGFFEAYSDGRAQEVFKQLDSGAENLSDYLTPGFALVESFIKKGYVDADEALVTKKTSDDLEAFARGGSPFMLSGAWAAGRVSDMTTDFKFEVVPLPVLPDGALEVINADTRLSVNGDSEHVAAAMRFVEYFTQSENIQKFADQQSSFSPLKNGAPSSKTEIKPLIACYEAGRTVIGADALLELSIWNLTADASKKLLSGEPLKTVMEWLDDQAALERGKY